MKKSLLLVILYLTVLQISAQEKILFEDDFNSNTSKNWTMASSNTFKTNIKNGVLVFDNSSNTAKTLGAIKGIDNSKDFKIEYKIKWISGKESKAIKLWFNKTDDNKNGQIFSFTANGSWIYEYFKNNNWHSSTGWQSSKTIKKNDWNHIKIVKFQNKIYVEINEKLILIKETELLDGNKISMTTYGSQVTHFDDFKVSYISNYETPEKDNSFILQDEEKITQTEDFSNTQNTLKPIINDDYKIIYPNGELLVVNETENSSIKKSFKNINTNKDFVVSFESQYKSGNINNIIYARIYNSKKSIFFGFSKNNKSFFRIHNNNKTVVKNHSKSSYLHHNSKNLIRLEKVKDILFFSINDKIINKEKINGCYDLGQKFAMGTDDDTNAVFDNLRVIETYRSVNEQNERIDALTTQYNTDKAQNELLLQQNKAQMEADEQKMQAEAAQFEIDEETRKKELQLKKDNETSTKYSNKLNLQPYLTKKGNYFRISTKGKHLLIYNMKYHYITVWNLETAKQVFSHQVKNERILKNIKLINIEFDWNETTKQPSIIGNAYNNRKEYFWFNGKQMFYGSETGLKTDYGNVLGVYNNEMVTQIRKFELDKKGKYQSNKPKYTQIQCYDFKLKKWRTYKFDKAKNAVISNAYKKLLVCYNDKVEVYEFTENFADYKLIKTIKNKNFIIHSFDDKQTNLVYLRRYKKNANSLQSKIVESGTFNLATNTFIQKGEPSLKDYVFTQSNFRGVYPKLNFEDANVPNNSSLKKIVLNHNNKSIYLTADKDDLSDLITRKLNKYIEKEKAIQKKKKLEEEARNEAMLSNLMNRIKRFGSSYKFSYSNFDYIQVGSAPFIVANNYNKATDLKVIGKFCDDTSGHFGTTKVLAIRTTRSNSGVGEQYVFELLDFSESGYTSKTIGITQKVRGRVTQLANLSLVKGSNGYTIKVNTDGRIKTFNVKSQCR